MTPPVYQLNEHILDSAVAKLAAGLSSTIDQINAADTKGIAVRDVPVDRIFDYLPTPTELSDFPAVGIAELDGAWTNDVGNSASGEWSFMVVAYDIDPEQRALVLRLRRLRQAIVSTIMEGRRLDHPTDARLGAWGLRFDATRPGPTLGRGENPTEWISWTSIAFTALAEDDPS